MPSVDLRHGLTLGVCSPAGSSGARVLGLATDGGTAVAVGGQGRDLFRWSTDGVAFHDGRSPGRGLRGALLHGDGLWVAGERGYLARSLDRGGTWQQLSLRTGGCLFGVVADDDGRLWVGGDGGFLAVSADGERFRPVKGVGESIARISNSPLGVLVPTDDPGHLYLCRGRTVERLGLVAGADLMSATVTPAGTVLAVGAGGAVFRSEDGGRSFARVSVPTGALLTAVRCLADGRVVVVGDAGTILVSDDDGRGFAALDQFVSAGMFWCCEPYGDVLLIGGDDGLVAWLGEQAPVTYPATPAAPVEERDGIYISPWLRAALHPRRGGIATDIRPLPTVDDAWAALRRALWAADRYRMGDGRSRSDIWKFASSDDGGQRRLGERMLDPAPRAGTVADDTALTTLVLERYARFVGVFAGAVYERLADFLVASAGLPHAVRCCFAGIDDDLPHHSVGPFGRLRELMVLADDTTYAQARAAVVAAGAAESTPTPHSRRRRDVVAWITAFLLPLGPAAGAEERAADERALRNPMKFGDFGSHPCGLATGGLAMLRQYRKANDRARSDFLGSSGPGRPYLASMLEVTGRAIVPLLIELRPGYPYEDDAYYNGLWSTLLAHVADDAALDALHRERRDGHPWGTTALLLAASFDADRIRGYARRHGDDDLADLVDRGIEPAQTPAQTPPVTDDEILFGNLGAPVEYEPPPAQHARRLDTPLAVEPEQDWRPEEREQAAVTHVHAEAVKWNGVPLQRCDEAEVDAFVANRERWTVPTDLPDLVLAPARVHERLMALGFQIGEYWARFALRTVLLRGGLSHLPVLLAALDQPDALEPALVAAQPFGDVSITPAVVKAFAGKKHKGLARSWLLRHPRHAAAGAVAQWAADREDTAAARVLRYLDARGHRATIREFAGELDITEAVEALLDTDPLAGPGVKLPVLPAFAAPEHLPAPAAAAGVASSGAVPDTAVPDTAVPSAADVAALVTHLAYSNADEVHPGVLAAKSRYTPVSLAAFAWALFEAWLAAGAPANEAWCLQAVGLLGDDDCARRLTALARKWPGENASARAKAALDALLNIGTDTALININLLAEKSRYPAFAAAARERIDAIAYARGLTADELADRLVPSLGLDEEGGDIVDTGAHKYRIAFDATLMPVLRDETGTLLTDVPRPGKADDRQLVKAAKAKLTALRKDARTSAALHVSRIERAMCAGRALGAAVFLDRYAGHPWLRHLANRLVWGVADQPGTEFRVAEDGTLADIDDDRYELPAGASVMVRHPLDMTPDAVAAWAQVFADYEILQPFPQLGRPVFQAADVTALLSDLRGTTVTYGQLRGLEARGWQRWYDGGVQMAKPLGGRLWAVLDTNPGWHASDTVDSVEPQTVTGVTFHHGDPRDVDTRTYSELAYDLHLLTSRT